MRWGVIVLLAETVVEGLRFGTDRRRAVSLKQRSTVSPRTTPTPGASAE